MTTPPTMLRVQSVADPTVFGYAQVYNSPTVIRDWIDDVTLQRVISEGCSFGDYLVHLDDNSWDATVFSDLGLYYTPIGVVYPQPPTVVGVATPSRSLGSAFQPNVSRPVMVQYSVRVMSSLSLTGGQAGRVELRSDSSNPPTTVRGRVAGGSTGTLAIGLGVNDVAEGQLSYLVPAGDYVELVTVNETGTPTYSLTAQSETTL